MSITMKLVGLGLVTLVIILVLTPIIFGPLPKEFREPKEGEGGHKVNRCPKCGHQFKD